MVVQISSGKYVGRFGVLHSKPDGSEYVEIYEDRDEEWVDVCMGNGVGYRYVEKS